MKSYSDFSKEMDEMWEHMKKNVLNNLSPNMREKLEGDTTQEELDEFLSEISSDIDPCK